MRPENKGFGDNVFPRIVSGVTIGPRLFAFRRRLAPAYRPYRFFTADSGDAIVSENISEAGRRLPGYSLIVS